MEWGPAPQAISKGKGATTTSNKQGKGAPQQAIGKARGPPPPIKAIIGKHTPNNSFIL